MPMCITFEYSFLTYFENRIYNGEKKENILLSLTNQDHHKFYSTNSKRLGPKLDDIVKKYYKEQPSKNIKELALMFL